MQAQGSHSEVVEGDRRVMGKQGTELVQAGEDHKGAAVVLGSQGHHMGAYRSHDAPIGQHYMCTHQHLQGSSLHIHHCDPASVILPS